MKRFLISYDRHGYAIGIHDVSRMSEREIRILAAEDQNYWWEQGGLDRLESAMSGWFEVIEGNREDVERHAAKMDCQAAWRNGMSFCTCGYPDCPQPKDDL